jgi:hypothetical protein
MTTREVPGANIILIDLRATPYAIEMTSDQLFDLWMLSLQRPPRTVFLCEPHPTTEGNA